MQVNVQFEGENTCDDDAQSFSDTLIYRTEYVTNPDAHAPVLHLSMFDWSLAAAAAVVVARQ